MGEPLIGPVHHRQWQCVEKSAIQEASQVAIYINKRFLDQFQIFPDFSPSIDPNVLPVTLRHNLIASCSFTIVNIYNPPKTRNSAVASLVRLLPRLNDALVIQGDFNLPSGIWDPTRNNSPPTSVDLFNHLSDEGFGLVNDEGAPTWTNRRGSYSVLDLVFIKDSIHDLEPDVFVNLEGRGRSDHALISLAFGTTEHWGRPYIPTGEEEEDRFVSDLSASIRRSTAAITTATNTNVESIVESIGQDILASWNRNSKTPRIGSMSTSWWTAECQQTKDAFLADRTRENQRIYDSATKRARTDFFNRKIDQMTANDSPWEGVRWTKPRPPPKYSTIRRDGQAIEDVATLFETMHTHFSTSPIGAREVIAGLPPLVILLNAQLHGFRARITALPPNHILCTAMSQKWTNPAYTSISRKTRPAHLPSDVPFRRLRTHHVQEQFEYASDLQRPGQRVLDTFADRITVDTYSPKKDTDVFKAWVGNLKQEIEQIHHEPHGVVAYTDGAFHHSDYKAAFAFTVFQNDSWHDHYDWCPAASSFDAELRAVEAALAHLTTRTLCDHVTLFIDNKAAASSLFNFSVKSSQMSIVRVNMLLDAWLSTSSERTLAIRFVPSHQGIAGNERADELTKAGLRLCPTNPPHILRSHFLSKHKRLAEHDWQQRWKDTTYRGSQWLPIRRNKKVFKPSFAKTSRNFFHNAAKGESSHLSRIAHVLTNHAPTGEYRTRFFPNEPTSCPHCDEDTLQTRSHILTECPWYVDKFSSITDWGKNRRNDKALIGFLDKNPSAFTFMDSPLDVH
ncbi:hypothetical protein AX14_006194 [Amanita brunnescens Koide BX004]|nr:hypothetical protein AX14_006194 [Amanita brunnescens Koide BX004]